MKYFVLITDKTSLSARNNGGEDRPFLSRLAASAEMGTVHLNEQPCDLLMGIPSYANSEDEKAILSAETRRTQTESEECRQEAGPEAEDTFEESPSPFFAEWQTKACCFTDSKELAEALAGIGVESHHLVIKTPLSPPGVPLNAAIRAAYASEHALCYFHLTESLADVDAEARAYLDEELNASLGELLEKGDIRLLFIAASEEEDGSDRPYLLYTPKTAEAPKAEASSEQEMLEKREAANEVFEETSLEDRNADADADFTYEKAAVGSYLADGETLFASLLGVTLSEKADKTPPEANKESEKKQPLAHTVFEWLELFVLSLCAVLILMTFLVRHSPVSGDSMNPTLENGDVLVISRLPYTPRNGDIVIVQTPDDARKPLVKRVIAVGGQTVRINFETWEVFINGTKVEEDYINRTLNVMEPYFTSRYFAKVDEISEIYEAVVPAGHVFVMGDNRNNSKDSRVLGFIDERYIIGDVIFRVSPLSSIGAVD